MTDGGSGSATRKLPPGAPVAPSFRSVVIRSILAAAVFWLFLSLGAGTSPGADALVVVIMFLFLLAFGFFFDRWFYRWRLRRWERKRTGGG